MLDLMNRLSGLVRAVRQQADLVFLDCSSIATLGLAFLSDQLNRFVEPKKWRVIFYQTRFLPHGREMYWKDNRGMKSIGTPLYPDLHSFSGSYIDFDPLLWGFFTTHL
jgi:hypothetical protein